MRERFISLAALLRPAEDAPPAERPEAEPPPAQEPAPADAVVRDVVLFRARLQDAFDEARARLLADLAADVLARELQLAPVAIEALANRLFEEGRDELPVALRVSPPDRWRVAVDVPVEADADLRPGDAVLVVRDGTLESTLGVRLDAVLRAAEKR